MHSSAASRSKRYAVIAAGAEGPVNFNGLLGVTPNRADRRAVYGPVDSPLIVRRTVSGAWPALRYYRTLDSSQLACVGSIELLGAAARGLDWLIAQDNGPGHERPGVEEAHARPVARGLEEGSSFPQDDWRLTETILVDESHRH